MTRHVLKMVWNRKRANALIVAEIFLSFLVLFGVLTLASAVAGSVRQPLGFDWRGVWNVSVQTTRVDGRGTEKEAIDQIMRELRAMPEVESVAASQTPPYAMSSNEGRWGINGKDVWMTIDSATDDFASVMRVKVLSGRWFKPSDDASNFTPIVIDADLARQVFGTENPVGKRFGDQESITERGAKSRRVVGVIAPYRKSGELANF
jgi:putative ABC transport system permease protein